MGVEEKPFHILGATIEKALSLMGTQLTSNDGGKPLKTNAELVKEEATGGETWGESWEMHMHFSIGHQQYFLSVLEANNGGTNERQECRKSLDKECRQGGFDQPLLHFNSLNLTLI